MNFLKKSLLRLPVKNMRDKQTDRYRQRERKRKRERWIDREIERDKIAYENKTKLTLTKGLILSAVEIDPIVV